jgi:hypothetical protein
VFRAKVAIAARISGLAAEQSKLDAERETSLLRTESREESGRQAELLRNAEAASERHAQLVSAAERRVQELEELVRSPCEHRSSAVADGCLNDRACCAGPDARRAERGNSGCR